VLCGHCLPTAGLPHPALLMHNVSPAQVQEKTGIAAAEQRLIFKGQVLKVGAVSAELSLYFDRPRNACLLVHAHCAG